MKNIENGLFRDLGDVEDFKATFGAKLRNVLRCNYGICHIQALLGEAITEESSRTEEALTSNIMTALDELDHRSEISIEMISFLVSEALEEVLSDNFVKVKAGVKLLDEIGNFGLHLPNSTDRPRGYRELSAGEELPF